MPYYTLKAIIPIKVETLNLQREDIPKEKQVNILEKEYILSGTNPRDALRNFFFHNRYTGNQNIPRKPPGRLLPLLANTSYIAVVKNSFNKVNMLPIESHLDNTATQFRYSQHIRPSKLKECIDQESLESLKRKSEYDIVVSKTSKEHVTIPHICDQHNETLKEDLRQQLKKAHEEDKELQRLKEVKKARLEEKKRKEEEAKRILDSKPSTFKRLNQITKGDI